MTGQKIVRVMAEFIGGPGEGKTMWVPKDTSAPRLYEIVEHQRGEFMTPHRLICHVYKRKKWNIEGVSGWEYVYCKTREMCGEVKR